MKAAALAAPAAMAEAAELAAVMAAPKQSEKWNHPSYVCRV